MALVLARVDDRLIHGQVVEGWLRVIQATRILVVSDEAAADPLQVRLMRLAVPLEVKVEVGGGEGGGRLAGEGQVRHGAVLLLMPGLKEARRLVEAGVKLGSSIWAACTTRRGGF